MSVEKIRPRAIMSNVPVWCQYDLEYDVSKLIEHPKNPNTHPEEQIKLLAKIIQTNGWRAPITVSKQSGFIVKGHGRLMAAKILNLETVPVDFQDYENDSLEYADLMADNRIAELSKIDKKKLLDLFENYDNGEVEFEISGYSEKDYQDLAHYFDEWDKEKPKKEIAQKKIVCPACGHLIEVR